MGQLWNTSRNLDYQAMKTERQKFWDRVPSGIPKDQCWNWLGGKSRNGRGQFYISGRMTTATRFMWLETHGEMPQADEFVCHSCDNPSCVNPDHLWLGSQSSNMKDAVKKRRLIPPTLFGTENHNGRKTHCKKGHEFSEANTTILARGGRSCKACNKLSRKHK